MEFSATTLEVQLECYEGPLAVLITLIKKNKVSIWDIPISLITERFLTYVEAARELHLKIAEDFIEMASLLIYIKSKMLLPSEDGDGEEEDPRTELVERILEYERLKGMVRSVESLPLLDEDVFVSGMKSLEGEEDFSLMTLCTIFLELLKNQNGTYLEIIELRPTLEEKLAILGTALEATGKVVWDYNDGADLVDNVATILAILELTKRKVARLTQRRPFGPVVIIRRGYVTQQN